MVVDDSATHTGRHTARPCKAKVASHETPDEAAAQAGDPIRFGETVEPETLFTRS